MEQKKCTNCGNKIDSNITICPCCDREMQPKKDLRQTRNNATVGAACLIFAILVLLDHTLWNSKTPVQSSRPSNEQTATSQPEQYPDISKKSYLTILQAKTDKIASQMDQGNYGARTLGGYPACLDVNDAIRARKLIDDREAIIEMTKEDGCIILKDNAEAYLMNYGYYGSMVQIRPKGHSRGFWTMSDAIKE